MKRWLSLILCLLCLAGCSSKQKDYGEQYVFEKDSQNGFYLQSLGGKVYMQQAENGYYYFDTTWPYVYFGSGDDLAKPICGKLNCLHDKETDQAKLSQCDAYLPSSIGSSLSYYNGHLYYLTLTIEWGKDAAGNDVVTNQYYELMEMSTDGTSRKSVYRFSEYFVQLFIIHRDALYYIYSDAPQVDEAGNTLDENTTTHFCRINLNAWRKSPEEIYQATQPGLQFNQLFAKGNAVYFMEQWADDTRTKSTVWQYDIMTGEKKKIAQDIAYYALGKDKIFYCTDDSTFITDMDGSNSQKLIDGIAFITADDNFLYCDELSAGLKDRLFTIRNYEGKVLQQFPLKGVSNSFQGVGGGKFFIKEEQEDHTTTLYAGEVSQIEGPAIELEKVLEFKPLNVT